MIESRVIRMQANAYRAVLGIELLADAAQVDPMSVRIARFLNGDICFLTQVLEDLKDTVSPPELAAFADRLRRSFVALQSHAGQCARRLGIVVRTAFRRMGGILYCLFRRGGRIAPEGAVLSMRETDVAFRTAVMDRIADGLRTIFAWLRDLCRRAEVLETVPMGPVLLGASAAKFVVTANPAEGVLVMRFQDGHQELFNLTPAQWRMILPLLVTPHSLGHARLAGRPQSVLTRHDANGDEIVGDMKRLKAYIHPVGRGRGGNGLYFLAPYPRQVNTVDR